MKQSEIIAVSKEIDQIRVKMVHGLEGNDLDKALYELQVFIFDLEDKKTNN